MRATPQLQARTALTPSPATTGALQRKCACGGTPGPTGECAQCRRKRLDLQRSAAGPSEFSAAPPIVHEVLRSPGRPLDTHTRAFMEGRFGHDFARVRVHTDERAAESARTVNALAYTVGTDVVFDTDRYAPATTAGRMLLAHELTHVVQQDGASVDLQQLSLAPDDQSPQEREARSASEAVAMERTARVSERANPARVHRQPKQPILTSDAAGGCGICYRGDVKAIGIDAHTQIKQEFQIMYPLLLPEFPIQLPRQTHIISKGIPDLILPTPTGFKVGEIKPANPEGYFEGEAKLVIYEGLLKEFYKKINPNLTVERMDLVPPPPLPYVEPASLTCTQLLVVGPPVRGVYSYLCQPPFSFELRQRCRCEGDKPPPPPVRQEQEVKEKVKERAKERDPKERVRMPGPEVLVPVGVAALLAWLAKKALGRVTAPATVIAAIVLVSSGAEASVGLEGDDPLEALFKAAAEKGTPIPDDLKDAIRNDPALKKILTDAAQTGDFTEAQRKLGEQLTRVVIENRDQFTEEEIQELLKMTEDNADVIPNAPITAEVLRRSLDAAKARGAKPPAGAEGAPRETEPAAPPSVTETPVRPPAGPELSAPARRLVDALVKSGGKGPKIDPDSLEKLREIVRSATPPLTDAEVDALLSKVVSAEGKTVDEVLAMVREGIADLRKPLPPEGDKPATGAEAGEAAKQGGPETGTPGTFPAPIERPKEEKPRASKEDRELGAAYAEAIAKSRGRFDFLGNGEAALLYDTKLVFKAGTAFSGYIVLRTEAAPAQAVGTLCLGSVTVTPRRRVSDQEWIMSIHGGSKVYGAGGGGVCGTTKTAEVRVMFSGK